VWARLTVPASGTLTVSTCGGATWDTVLGIAGAGSISNLASNDDLGGACGVQSQVALSVTVGNTYYLQLGGLSSSTGVATVKVTLR
jgi:hypothetical protein